MSRYVNIKIKNLLFLTATLFAFISINSTAYAQIPDVDFQTTPDINSFQQYTDESDVYYKNGMEFLNSKQYTKAIDSFEKALSLAPDRTTTRINLAVTYINRGTYFYNQLKDFDKSASDYRNAIYLLKYDNFVPTSDMAAKNLAVVKADLDNIYKDAQVASTKSSRLRIARELRGQGKFKEALVEFYESLEGNQTDFPIYTAIADISSVLQNEKTAIKYYRKAIEYNTNNADLHLKLAQSLNNSGDSENAVKEFNIALKTTKKEDQAEVLQDLENLWVKKLQDNPQDASAHMNLGVVLQKKGDFDGALKEYQFAEEINPNDITTRLNIGTLCQAKKDYTTAINAYNTILQVNPDNLWAHYYKGTALRDMGQLDDAIKEFQFVLNKDASNTNAKEALFDTVKMFPDNQDVSAIFKTFADNNPTDAIAQYKYGFHLHSLKRLDEAFEYYKKTIALDPKFADAYLNMAVMYKEKNQTNNAISSLQNGLKSAPKNQKLKEMLSSLNSQTVTSRYQNALNKHNQGKYDEAIKEYLSIIQISEPDADLYINLGAAYQASKKLNDAAGAYIKATQIDSKNSTALYYLGTVYSAQGKNEEASKAYRKALVLDPENKDIKQALKDSNQSIKDSSLQTGINEYNKGKYSEALLIFNTLSMKDPNNGNVYYYRGMVYDALKKYQLAIADYKLTIKFSPDLSYAYYAIAVDYDTLRNYPEAKKWYSFFIIKSINKSDQYVKYARDRIKQI
ncbi:MAG: tetratricopeptide repeat protein [bacterium]